MNLIKGDVMGLFGGSKSPEDKEFEEQLKYYVGGKFSPSDYFYDRKKELDVPRGTMDRHHVKDILRSEYKDGKLSPDGVKDRVDELLHLNCDSMFDLILEKGYDTSLIKTPEELEDFLVYAYGEEYGRDYKRNSRFEKFNIDSEGAYCFDTQFMSCALFDDKLIIVDDTGSLPIPFDTVDDMEYHRARGVDLWDQLTITLKNEDEFKLRYITKNDADEVKRRFSIFSIGDHAPASNADELLKYAELYEKGLLTEEEFEAKKKELL